jgi:hypothetical protein
MLARGPIAVAKNAGHPWAGLTTQERRLVADVCRFLNRQHETEMSKLMTHYRGYLADAVARSEIEGHERV